MLHYNRRGRQTSHVRSQLCGWTCTGCTLHIAHRGVPSALVLCTLSSALSVATPRPLLKLTRQQPAALLLLLQDPFGNYVVQYVLELGDTSASGAVMRGLAGHWPDLAQQKFSSNVVEKCLKLPGLAATQVLVVVCCYMQAQDASSTRSSSQQGCVPRVQDVSPQ